jgi:hypothetical protein
VGFSISWLAVKGQSPEAVVASLGLKDTGAKGEYGEEMHTGCSLPGGWFLIVVNQCEHPFIAPPSLSKLSADSEVIACSIEEHVMVSTSECWKGGARLWRIEHNAQENIEHLTETGALPEGYSAIKRSLLKQQEEAGGKEADVDYFFDIPLTAAKSIVGFKHDESSGLADGSFVIFAETTAKSKPWWKLWQ